jgi:hypothetical protein
MMQGDERIDLGSVERFLRLALRAGTINAGTAQRLSDLARTLSPPPAAPAPGPAVGRERAGAAVTLEAAVAFLADPAASRLRPEYSQGLAREIAWLRHGLQGGDGEQVAQNAARLAGLLGAARRSLVEAPAARPAAPPAPQAPVAPRPPAAAPAVRRPAGPTWSERARRRLGDLRRAVGSDFAIHGITYLGVFLALVTLVVFFAVDDYFGRTFRTPWTRPFIFLVFPAFFFVLAWVLRHRSGIPQAAIAIELIGAVLVPAMVAALFRDGFWFPPNVEQLGRWVMYAGSALPALLVFWLLARRRRLYAYLIAPTVWTMAGALGLYLHFHWIDEPGLDRPMPEGMSAYQIVLILTAMAATVLIAVLIRETSLGKLVSIPTVRVAVAVAPFVLIAAIQFAYADAVTEGLPGVSPGLEQMDLPVALAAAATGALYLAARRARFAWEGLPDRARRDLPEVVAALGSAALVTAAGLGFADVVPLPWAGAILCAAGVGLAAAERIPWFGSRSGLWLAASGTAAGLALSLGSGGATAAAWGLAALALAVSPEAVLSLFRTPAAPESMGRVLLGATTVVALGAGVARLAWPEGTVWVLVGSSALLGGTQFLERLPARVRSLAQAPAAVLVAAALGVAAARAAAGDGPGYAASGGLVLAAAAAVFLLDLPWVTRLVPGTALLAAGGLVEVRPALESGSWVGAAADAAVLGILGLGLVADALLRRSGRHRLWHGALGHLLVLASLGRSLEDERAALVGLGALFVAMAAEAGAVEFGRSALMARIASLPGVVPAWQALPAAAAAAALPFLTVLAGQRIPAVAAEGERRGLVLAVAALGFAAAVLVWRRRARLQAVAAVGGAVIALAGVAWAAPSATGVVLTTGAATVTTAVIAVGCRLSWATALPWAGAAAALLLGLWRAGVSPLDLRYGMLGAGALMAAGPAVVQWRRGRPSRAFGPWLWPPLLVGVAQLVTAVGFGLARPRLLGLVALAAAGIGAFVGWSARAGWASVPVAAAATIGYAHLLEGPWPPFSNGLRFMPLAGALVVASILLPGRRAWRGLADASPGTLVSGLAVAAIGVGVDAARGEAAPALLCLAGLLALVWAARRADGWLFAAGLTALAGGFAGAPEWWWLTATAAADALVLGALAVRRAEREEAPLLAWTAAALAAVAFGAMTEWGAWPTAPLLAASATATAVTLVMAAGLALPRSWAPGVALWQWPALALALGAGITLMSQGHLRLGGAALGIDAGALAAFAAAAGLVGTRRLQTGLAGGAALLTAAAYGCLAGWLDWPAGAVVGVTATVGGGLGVAAAGLSLWPRVPAAAILWRLPLHALAQAAAVTVAAVALAEFGAPAGLGVVSGVLAGEALLAGVLGTAWRHAGLAAVSALCASGAYGCLAGWLEWEASLVVAVTAVVGGGLAVTATALSYWRGAPRRAALWRGPLHALAQVAAVAVAGVALREFATPEGLGVVAAVLAAEAVLTGAVGTVERWPQLVAVSAGLIAGAYGCLAGWLEWDADLVVGVSALAGGVLAAGASMLSRWRGAPGGGALWRLPLHALAQTAVVAVAVVALREYGAARSLSVVAAACAFEALYLGVNAGWLPSAAGPRILAAESATASVFLALAAVGQAGRAAGLWVQGAAVLALVAAIGHGLLPREHPWATPTGLFAGLVAPGAAVAAAWMLGAPYGHTAGAVAFGGAGLVAVGLLRRRLPLVEGGLIAWLGAGLIAFNERVDFTSHTTVVPVAAALLVVVEVERGRRRREGKEPSGQALRLLEWALLLAPLALCVADAAGRLWFLGVLTAEGLALMGWGVLTEVRRRALLGVGAVAMAILLSAIIPLSRGVRGGLADETWLLIGGGAALLLIAIGSFLERYRRTAGRALAAASRAMEGWE